MTFDEREKAEEQKREILRLQNGICETCKVTFRDRSEVQAAHRICKSKVNLAKYGNTVINHRLNLACTHGGDCNDAVMVSPDKHDGRQLLIKIYEDLVLQLIDFN